MKNFKKVLALVLAVATLLSFATFAGAYTDVNFGDDYAEAIEVLSAIGVLEGNTGYAGAYRPKDTITREEAAKLIAIFDNGSTDIADLYTATNPFADVVGRWSASYVGYCYKAGIVVGPRANMFEPKENVTGTQFLKMALTVLDLDAEKEALVGPSWDVNALKLANDIGLTDGLAANWKPEAALTRGEAAQIMYNTLCAETYKYGSAIHYFGQPEESNQPSFITVAGAYPSGHYLYEKWGLEADTTYDAFERPYYTWYKGSKKLISVMYPVLAQYTVRVDGCKVLVDLGVKKTDVSTKLAYDFYRNGVKAPEDLYNGELKHTVEAPHCIAEGILFGSQGTLTQVFKIDKTYRITSIETWLAKVTKVSKVTTSKDGHKLGSANVTVDPLDGSHAWENRNEYCEYAFDHELGDLGRTFNYGNPGDLAVDDYVLITYSWKHGSDRRALGVQSAVKTDPVNGKLTGFIDRFADDADRCTTTRVDYAEKPDSYHFHLGYGASKDTENVGGTFAFFYDTYGNVIGMTDKIVTAAKTYAVIDKAWGYWNNGDSGLKADVVFLDASKKNVEVAKLWGDPTKNIAEIDVLPDWVYGTEWFDIEDYRAYMPAYGTLMTYSVNADGSYVLDDARAPFDRFVYIKKGNPNLWENPDYTGTYIPTNEKTQYLLKNPDGSYVAYTGFEEIPTCCLNYCEWIVPTGSVYASIVYGEVSYYDADGAVAFVTKPDHRDYVTFEGNPNVYAQYEGYVNGVKTPIYVNVADDAAPGFFGGIVGLYKLTFKTDEYGVLVCTARTNEWDIYDSTDTVVKCDINSLVVSGHNAIAIKDKPVYVYEVETGSFTAGTIEDLTAGTKVFLYGSSDPYKADGSGLKAIFVIDYDL